MTTKIDRSDALLVLLLALSALVRVHLSLDGGQFFWPDELRFHQAEAAARLALSGEFFAAVSQQTMSIEHLGYKVVAAVLECARLLFGLPPRATYLVFSQFSTLNIFWVWLIARRLNASREEALFAAAFMACSASMVVFSRHIVPYDLTLSFWLAALAVAAKDRPGPAALAGAGCLAVMSFVTYNGSWFLLPVLGALYVMRRRGEPAGTVLRGAAFAGMGGAATLALLGFTGRSVPSVVAEYKTFAKTITMGEYEDGWRFPLEYLWQCDGLLLLAQLVAVAVLAARVLRGGARLREKLYLAGLALAYLLLGGSSAIFKAFVVYGRTARLLEPFLCLAAGWFAAAHLAPRGGGRPRKAALALVLAALAAQNFAGPWHLVFKDRFERGLEARYGKYRTASPFGMRETGETPPAPPTCPEAVVASQARPMSYLPYRYEGAGRELRAYMAAHRQEFEFYKCRYDLPCLEVDFLAGKVPPDVMTAGLGEKSDHRGVEALWAMGPSTTLEFWEHGGREVRLRYELLAVVVPVLEVEVFVNGTRREAMTLKPGDNRPGLRAGEVAFAPEPGLNVVEFRFSAWNGNPETVITADARPFAAAFSVLRLENVSCRGD